MIFKVSTELLQHLRTYYKLITKLLPHDYLQNDYKFVTAHIETLLQHDDQRITNILQYYDQFNINTTNICPNYNKHITQLITRLLLDYYKKQHISKLLQNYVKQNMFQMITQ